MPATVIEERLGWEHSITILKDRVRQIRPEYAGVDPADRLVHHPGEAANWTCGSRSRGSRWWSWADVAAGAGDDVEDLEVPGGGDDPVEAGG